MADGGSVQQETIERCRQAGEASAEAGVLTMTTPVVNGRLGSVILAYYQSRVAYQSSCE
jgi:hypothetical protein